MAIYQVLGAGPIAFTDHANNQQSLPLSQVFSTANGLDLTASPLLGSDGPLLYALLHQLAAEGLIAPAVAALSPATLPSLTLTAAQAGSWGNGLTVDLIAPSVTAGTVGVSVGLEQSWAGLTPTTIGDTLGTEASASGLVYVEDQNPANPLPVDSFHGTIRQSAPEPLLIPDAASSSQGSFTLAATTKAAAGNWQLEITVSLDPIPDPAPDPTFTLTAKWTARVAPLSWSSLLTANPFQAFVLFSGLGGPLPAAGSVKLEGGAEAVAATSSTPAVPAIAASASAYASS